MRHRWSHGIEVPGPLHYTSKPNAAQSLIACIECMIELEGIRQFYSRLLVSL
jgi:hypothetical protein